MLRLVGVRQGDFTARRGVLAGEQDRVGHLFHGQVPDRPKGTSACGAASEFGPAVGAYLESGKNSAHEFFSIFFFFFIFL